MISQTHDLKKSDIKLDNKSNLISNFIIFRLKSDIKLDTASNILDIQLSINISWIVIFNLISNLFLSN